MSNKKIIEHNENVRLYGATSDHAASSGPTAPLSKSQIEAYLKLPSFIDACRKSYNNLDESLRPLHHLMPVLPVK